MCQISCNQRSNLILRWCSVSRAEQLLVPAQQTFRRLLAIQWGRPQNKQWQADAAFPRAYPIMWRLCGSHDDALHALHCDGMPCQRAVQVPLSYVRYPRHALSTTRQQEDSRRSKTKSVERPMIQGKDRRPSCEIRKMRAAREWLSDDSG